MSLRQGSVRDLFWNFARAEFENPTDRPRHAQPTISLELKERIVRDERATLSARDWEALREAVLSTRSFIVEPLLDMDAEWFLGELPSTEWADVRVMNLRMFVHIAPSRRLIDLATALDRGALPQGWDPTNYPQLRSKFDRSLMHGDPIVVAQHRRGPYTLIEGVTRMCALLSKNNRGEIDVRRIPMLLGLSRRFGEWEFY
jgi:hypothetical protein